MNKKVLVSVLGILGIIIVTAGVTYAFFSYSRTGTKINKIKSGLISFNYKEDNQGISLDDAMPMTDIQGKSQSNYFDFTITSKTSDTLDIPYYITVVRSGTGTNMDGIVKLYLTKVDDNGIETEVALQTFSSLGTYTHNSINILVNEKLLYSDKVFAGDSNYNQKYRLRMWIDDESEFIVNNTYPYEGKTYQIKINVYSNGETASHDKLALRENANISDIEEGLNVLTTDTSTFTATEVIEPGQTVLNKTITINTENPNSKVTVTKRGAALESNIKRLASTKQIELTYGTNTFDIVVTSENRRETKNYVLIIEVEYPSYEVTLTGSNITATSPTLVKYNENKNTTITVADNYYLDSVSCTNGYTVDTTTGVSATGSRSITIKNNGNVGNSTCTFTTTALNPTVTISGSNATYGSSSIEVAYNSYNTVTVTPSSNYYLSSVSCTNGYITNAQTGISATGNQTITVTNPGTYDNSTCTFTMARYYTSSSQIANATTGNVAACDISNDKYYNCNAYSTLQAAFDSKSDGYVVIRKNLTTSSSTTVDTGKIFTLDLYGKTLTCNASTNCRGIINNGNLTINNSTNTRGGILSSGGAAVRNNTSSAVLVINDGDYSTTKDGAPAINIQEGNITINFGMFHDSNNNNYSVIGSDESTSSSTSNLVINGGDFYNNPTASSNIITSYGSTITINNGSFEQIGTGVVISNNLSGTITIKDGDLYALNNHVIDNKSSGTINITNGKFLAYSDDAIMNAHALFNESTGTINVNQTSNFTYISSKKGVPIFNASSGKINIMASRANYCTETLNDTTSGLCTFAYDGRVALRNDSSGVVTINGGSYVTQATGGSIMNYSTGTVKIKNAYVKSNGGPVINNNSGGRGTTYVCSSTVNGLTSHFANNYSGDVFQYYNVTFQGVSTTMTAGTNNGTLTQVNNCPF